MRIMILGWLMDEDYLRDQALEPCKECNLFKSATGSTHHAHLVPLSYPVPMY
jgi:hypothetical protein